MKIIVGNEHLTDEEMFCPQCGVCIEYESRNKPSYCPKCGSKLEVQED